MGGRPIEIALQFKMQVFIVSVGSDFKVCCHDIIHIALKKIKAPGDINDPAKTIGKNLRQPYLSPFLAFNKKPVIRLA